MTTAPTMYTVRVEGHLDDHWSNRLSGFSITRDAQGTSTLTGAVSDQAQLHGLLIGLRDIGATLLELRAGGQSADADARTETRSTPSPVLVNPLHTSRLLLRHAVAEDADRTWQFRRLESVNEWLTRCSDDLDGYRELFTDPARLATTIIIELKNPQGDSPGWTGGPVIGDLMLRREDAWAQFEIAQQARGTQAELGWVLDPVHAGRGYATEAVRELIRHCFDDLGVHRVTANCFVDNEASWRLMERVGMRRETHAVRESLHRSGQWLDSFSYALLADEWRTS